jgi:hypothetical protein
MKHACLLAATRSPCVWLLALATAWCATAAPASGQAFPWIGLTTEGAQLFLQQGSGVFAYHALDQFGFAAATGDFDGNGADDLVTGVPLNDCDNTTPDCGSAVIRWGLPGVGLTWRLQRRRRRRPSPSADRARLVSTLLPARLPSCWVERARDCPDRHSSCGRVRASPA